MAGRGFVPLGEQLEDEEERENQTTQEKVRSIHFMYIFYTLFQVVALINEAQLMNKDKKLECLSQV